MIKGGDKGYKNVVLDAHYLDNAFINELLQKSDTNWPSEFATNETNGTRTSNDRDIIEDVLTTASVYVPTRLI